MTEPMDLTVNGGSSLQYLKKIQVAGCPKEIILRGAGKRNVNLVTELSACLQRVAGDVLGGVKYSPLEITTTWKYRPHEHGVVTFHFEREVGS